MLKKVFFAAISVVFLSGCSSSDRMMRMTGSYLTPSINKIDQSIFSSKSGGYGGTQINAWPVFSCSNDYYSVLWPIFDYDQYGMAIRPFYVQEGDEYTVLFPLSAWNPKNGDGWVLSAFWNKESDGFFPFYLNFPTLTSVGPVWWKKGKSEYGFFPVFGNTADGWNFFGPFGVKKRVDVQLLPAAVALEMEPRGVEKEIPAEYEKYNYLMLGYIETGVEWQNIFCPIYFFGKDYGVIPPAITWWNTETPRTEVTSPLCIYREQDEKGYVWTPLVGWSFGNSCEPWVSVLNTYWDNDSAGCIPLFHFGKNINYVAPGVFWELNKYKNAIAVVPLLSGLSYEKNSEIFKRRVYFMLFFGGKHNRQLNYVESFIPYEIISTVVESMVENVEFVDVKKINRDMEIMDFEGDASDASSRKAFYEYLLSLVPDMVPIVEEREIDTFLVDVEYNNCGDYTVDFLGSCLASWAKSGEDINFDMLLGVLADVKSGRKDNGMALLAWLFYYNMQTEYLQSEMNNFSDKLCDLAKKNLQQKIYIADEYSKDYAEDYNDALRVTQKSGEALGITIEEDVTWQEIIELSRSCKDENPPPLVTKNWCMLWFAASGEIKEKSESAQVLWFLYNYKRENNVSLTRFFPFFVYQENNEWSEFSWIWSDFMSVKYDAEGNKSGHIFFIPW